MIVVLSISHFIHFHVYALLLQHSICSLNQMGHTVKISRNLNRNQLARTVQLFYPRNLFGMDTRNDINPNISLSDSVDESDGIFCNSIDAQRVIHRKRVMRSRRKGLGHRVQREVSRKRIANEA